MKKCPNPKCGETNHAPGAIYCHLCGYKLHQNKFKNFMKSEWPPIILGICGMVVAGGSAVLPEFFDATILTIPLMIAGGCLMVASAFWIKIRY